jgi:hypothetical protein
MVKTNEMRVCWGGVALGGEEKDIRDQEVVGSSCGDIG